MPGEVRILNYLGCAREVRWARLLPVVYVPLPGRISYTSSHAPGGQPTTHRTGPANYRVSYGLVFGRSAVVVEQAH